MKYARLHLEKVLVRCEIRMNDVGKEQGISGEAKGKYVFSKGVLLELYSDGFPSLKTCFLSCRPCTPMRR